MHQVVKMFMALPYAVGLYLHLLPDRGQLLRIFKAFTAHSNNE